MIHKKDILDLSINERISMIGTIWETIDKDDIQPPVSHREELDRRLDRLQRGETKFYEWEDIKSDLHKKR
ncbi:addiction module protein [Olivibacter sitiensis]|uniref:addiction module protein n=1 Tax=Olivibacter sitiensis TaxID=376470 RepID=UPI00040BF8F3|nr:addiction module protein [Olivibacter sitiensis]